MDMIFTAIAAASLIVMGYSLASMRHHRFMKDAWGRCLEVTQTRFPDHVDDQWSEYNHLIIDQFSYDRFNDSPFRKVTNDERTFR